jgi:hypothetical protein
MNNDPKRYGAPEVTEDHFMQNRIMNSDGKSRSSKSWNMPKVKMPKISLPKLSMKVKMPKMSRTQKRKSSDLPPPYSEIDPQPQKSPPDH